MCEHHQRFFPRPRCEPWTGRLLVLRSRFNGGLSSQLYYVYYVCRCTNLIVQVLDLREEILLSLRAQRRVNLYPLPATQSRPHHFGWPNLLVYYVHTTCCRRRTAPAQNNIVFSKLSRNKETERSRVQQHRIRSTRGLVYTEYCSTVDPPWLGTHAVGPADRLVDKFESNTAGPFLDRNGSGPLGLPSRCRLWNGTREVIRASLPFFVGSCSGWRVQV